MPQLAAAYRVTVGNERQGLAVQRHRALLRPTALGLLSRRGEVGDRPRRLARCLAAVQAGGDLGAASLAGVAVARQAIADLQGPGGDTSATTFVSAVASGYEVTLCWLGDSRAYWLGQPAEESRLLTRDDSVAGGMVAAGLVDEAAAMASPHAHVLTRWLGGEAADLADFRRRAGI